MVYTPYGSLYTASHNPSEGMVSVTLDVQNWQTGVNIVTLIAGDEILSLQCVKQ